MAKSNLLSTSTSTLLELIGNGRSYEVPPYQRDYSWTEEQWEDLWLDLSELAANSDAVHYMGAIVIEEKTDRLFSIIDGQQRVATLSIFVLAVIAELHALANKGSAASENRQRAEALRSRFVGERDPASLVESSKLSLNAVDNAFYQDYLVQLREPHNPRALPKSNRLLYECSGYFRRQISMRIAEGLTGEGLARLASETAGRQLMFIRILVDDELNAYTVFETLNARGLGLSSTDLLKNYLFSRLRTKSDLAALQRRWQALLRVVGQERFPEFLRYHLQCELPRVRSQRLFKLVRERVGDGASVFLLLDELERRSEVFAALFDPTHAYWIDRRGCAVHVSALNVLKVRQMTPLVFAAWERFSEADFTRLLKLLVAVLFRYSAVSGLNTNTLELTFHEAARAVLKGGAKGPSEVFSTIQSIYIDDERFRDDFMRLAPEDSRQGKKLTQYILGALESDASGRTFDPNSDPASIEHVLPENPVAEWDESFPTEAQVKMVGRLGNMTLLEPGLNREVGNASLEVKLEAYRRSRYQLTAHIAEMEPSEWTPSSIEARQRHLAGRAVHIWRSDFA